MRRWHLSLLCVCACTCGDQKTPLSVIFAELSTSFETRSFITEAHQWTSPSDPPVSASPLLELQVRTAMPSIFTQVLGTELESSCLWGFTGWALGPRCHSCQSSCPLRLSTSRVSSLWAFDILVTKTDDTSEYTHSLPLTPTQRGKTLLSMSMAGWWRGGELFLAKPWRDWCLWWQGLFYLCVSVYACMSLYKYHACRRTCRPKEGF